MKSYLRPLATLQSLQGQEKKLVGGCLRKKRCQGHKARKEKKGCLTKAVSPLKKEGFQGHALTEGAEIAERGHEKLPIRCGKKRGSQSRQRQGSLSVSLKRQRIGKARKISEGKSIEGDLSNKRAWKGKPILTKNRNREEGE